MTDWTKVLHAIAPRAKSAIVAQLADSLDEAFDKGGLTTPLRQAHFLARAAVETDAFTTLQEIGGAAYFKRYDGRKDLGNTRPGDGARFRGRGIFQCTGRANYARYGKRLGVDLVKNPDQAAAGDISLQIAILYWNDHGLNARADRDDVVGVCRAVNGGTNGLADQKTYLARAKRALAAAPAKLGLAALPAAEDTPAADLGDPDADPGPLPRGQVAALQGRLHDLGYAPGGTDGVAGSMTTAAVAAFQHDHAMPITGAFDPATTTAIWDATDKRPIPADRANGVPHGSRIFEWAKHVRTTALAGIGVTGLSGMAPDSVLDGAEKARSYWDRGSALLAPFAVVRDILAAHPLIVIAILCAGGLVVAEIVKRARVQDFREGATP